jgi:hypothetical protein
MDCMRIIADDESVPIQSRIGIHNFFSIHTCIGCDSVPCL